MIRHVERNIAKLKADLAGQEKVLAALKGLVPPADEATTITEGPPAGLRTKGAA